MDSASPTKRFCPWALRAHQKPPELQMSPYGLLRGKPIPRHLCGWKVLNKSPVSCHVAGDRRTGTVLTSEHGYLLAQGGTASHCYAVLWLRGVRTPERR
ncbi:hypothetical protein EYF80_013304 [Liparis tanakae]|uniref:Uncharacterized protein n=1 Tax=Liparis tanakae TaxID=230148 RepID=A0A4Z2IEA7_9TELE|nr:hypothetical protein EYF80_013304 [Liparis tanakae]